MARIFIVDDEPATADWISSLCRDRGHQPFHYYSSAAAAEALSDVAPHLVIADLNTEEPDGPYILRECREKHPETVVVVLGPFDSADLAPTAMQSGAFDYLRKPLKADEMQFCIQRALDHQATLQRTDAPKRENGDRYKFENLLGTSPKMQSIYKLIGKVADTESTILIQGESGTGKELVARALHYNSSRQNHPFVSINCSALPDNLLESELFGHKKGSFNGAVMDKTGLFEEGKNGTLFLDEINSMSQQL
ncbi:MAG: two-component system, NtrC family, response regulator PilR, partial [Verrucomicrobiota bacterium]